MFTSVRPQLTEEIQAIRDAGLYKTERVITTPQSTSIGVATGQRVINFCANNYLGLSNDAGLIEAGKKALDAYGYGLSSVRFICGTQSIHKQLEAAVSRFLGTEDTILYSSCFDANGGLFEVLLTEDDAIISDQLNHASIIDGVRLCKAQRYRYANSDMAELESILKEAQGARRRLIATDGVFSMDGIIARLDLICDLAEKYDAMVMVDDSHATGFVGKTGRGTPELCGVQGRVDIITSTLGKALGGATGGFTSARKEIVELLRQRSRPYLFSNSIPPVVAGAAIEVIRRLSESSALVERVAENTAHFRQAMAERGFNIPKSTHAICPIMLGDARLAQRMAEELLKEGIYVIGFSYPVVPKGAARIRVQISAAHTREQLDQAIEAFTRVRDRLTQTEQ